MLALGIALVYLMIGWAYALYLADRMSLDGYQPSAVIWLVVPPLWPGWILARLVTVGRP